MKMYRLQNPHKSKTRQVLAFYALATILVIGPLLTKGYILTLDMVFTPELGMPGSVSSNYLLRVLLHVLNSFIAADVIQKLLLFAIFVMAGLGMHRLVRRVLGGLAEWTGFAGGLLYMVNPFTYERLMAGQYLVLFGYALLPWFAASLYGFLREPGWKRGVALADWSVAISIVSIHTVGMALIVAVLMIGQHTWQQRQDRAQLKQLGVYLGGVVAACVLASSYWLFPILAGVGGQAQTVHSITSTDRLAFATTGATPFERLGNVVGLQGFWAERYTLFTLPQNGALPVWLWTLIMLVMLSSVIIGTISLWRHRGRSREIAFVFAGSVIIGSYLASGIGGNWLAAHLPFFAGYREPQKFVALVALGYGVLASQGFAVMVNRASRIHIGSHRHSQVVAGALAGLLILVPALIAPTIWWGGNGQLRAAEYPAGWYAVNRQLNADTSNFKTLVLPWHMYSYMSFAGRVIANPARNFFDKPVIVSNNPELAGVALDSSDADAQQISALLADPATASSDQHFGKQLKAIGVKYVIVAHETDYQKYNYLDKQKNLTKTADHLDIALYRVN